MIYHNYSPYYYGTSTNLNRKTANNNNSYPLIIYNNANKNNYSAIPYNNNLYYNSKLKNTEKNFKKNHYTSTFSLSNPSKESCNEYLKEKKTPPKTNNDAIFEIFGIKLYFDDILLICLIFFLYNEGVQDQYLFIALVLLLLS